MLAFMVVASLVQRGNGIDYSGIDPGDTMLFGVRVVMDLMKKFILLGTTYESSNVADVTVAADYASTDDVVHHSFTSRERKRGRRDFFRERYGEAVGERFNEFRVFKRSQSTTYISRKSLKQNIIDDTYRSVPSI